MLASPIEKVAVDAPSSPAKNRIYDSITRLTAWLERNDYRGYDTFDGLSSKLLRPLTFGNPFLRTVLQQAVRRIPINIRPLIGIGTDRSTKGMGFIARGYIRLYDATGDAAWRAKAIMCLDWLMEKRSPGYTGACWGNHFDYQARGDFYLPAGVPTVVWTSLIGQAFLDGYDRFGKEEYFDVAESACEHILHDLYATAEGNTKCISYTPTLRSMVHNANVLGGGLLARVYSHNRKEAFRDLAEKSIAYTANQSEARWFLVLRREAEHYHWVDNFHTAYVLDSFKHYAEGTGDQRFQKGMMEGYEYWKKVFFLADGTPRYYDYKTYPLDIQCAARRRLIRWCISTPRIPEALTLALKVAQWTIEHMQDSSGYFYYRRYPWAVNRTPTLHWGQATMLSALAGLYKSL